MSTQHTRFDVAEYLVDDETIAAYLEACLEEGGVTLFQKAVGDVARARGMGDIASTAGVTRASLYKSLTQEGNPALSTMNRVIETFGLRFSIQPLTAMTRPKASDRLVSRKRQDVPTQLYRTGTRGKPMLVRSSAASALIDSRSTSMATKKSSAGSATARSAKSGEFVTKTFAKAHPATTLVEHSPKAAKKSSGGPAVARSAKSGEFVSMASAKKHPATTVVEHNRKLPKKGK